MSMCLAFDRTKYLCGDYNYSIPIFLNGSKLQWVKCGKHLGNYISYDCQKRKKLDIRKVTLYGGLMDY